MNWGLPQIYIAVIWSIWFFAVFAARPKAPRPKRDQYIHTALMAFMFPGSALALHFGGFW